MRKAPLNRVQFRLERVEADWRGLVEIIRQVSAEPDYAGPSFEIVETIERAMVEVRSAVQTWATTATQRRAAARDRRAARKASAGDAALPMPPLRTVRTS